MDDRFLETLRCPLDPAREATFTRDKQQLICSGCQVQFPIKNGLPILLATEAELPSGVEMIDRLPCRRASGRSRSRS